MKTRSALARRITTRHYGSIGSIPPLPLWQVIDEEAAPLMKALNQAADSLYNAYAEIGIFLGGCSPKEIRDSFSGLNQAANRAEKTRSVITALLAPKACDRTRHEEAQP